jgi:hypothetical protein
MDSIQGTRVIVMLQSEIEDEPVLSLRRIIGAIRQWFYLAVVCEVDMKYGLLHLIKYHRRPFASHRDGYY